MTIRYGYNCKRGVQVANLFNQTYLHLTNISQNTVSKIHTQFRELGHVRLVKRTHHFVESVEQNPTSSAR